MTRRDTPGLSPKGEGYGLTMLLHGVREFSRANLEGLDPNAARARQKEKILNGL